MKDPLCKSYQVVVVHLIKHSKAGKGLTLVLLIFLSEKCHLIMVAANI